ncbi:MAG: tRNA (adenine-N1)-methyltransferase [Betaproteobacteria bacterium]|nr:tRNA (adenine-N1)-methyltransferase [Betaproteobacteria bacterium]
MPPLGSLVIVVTPKGKRRLIRVEEGRDWHSTNGVLSMRDVVATDYGREVRTSQDLPIRLYKPGLYDLVKGVKRQTQIIYPKDIAHICLRLGAGPGRRILEAGSGSGALTLALSWFCGPSGEVHSCESREEFHKLARLNLSWAGIGDNVTLYLCDIAEGFPIQGADALFLDVRTPWEYLSHVPQALRSGAQLGFLLPTVEQVSALLRGIERGPYDDVEVCELLLRRWKPLADRLRPDDRMIAHTGFLVFCRLQECSEEFESLKPAGTRERKQEAARQKRLATVKAERGSVSA